MTDEGRKRESGPSWEEASELLERLPRLPLESRIAAVERLIRSSSPHIRDAALRVGAAVLDDARLAEQLRNRSDAATRNAALEILKLKGARAFPTAKQLLADDNAQVVLQAIQILDHLRDPRALEPLRCLLDHEDANVVQHTIVALGHIGDARIIPDLLRFLEADVWLRIGAVSALGELRARDAVPALRELLDDPLVGGAAADALARIGGPDAFRALAEVWLVADVPVLDVQALELLAHVLEGLVEHPADLRGYAACLGPALGSPDPSVSQAAARCALVLGPSDLDERALTLLADSAGEAYGGPERRFRHRDAALPACLVQRPDLIGRLLVGRGLIRCWGLMLASREPARVPVETLRETLLRSGEPVCAECTARALAARSDAALVPVALELYAHWAPEQRQLLRPVLRRHGAELPGEEVAAPNAGTRVLLAEMQGESPERVAREIDRLPPEERRAVVTELRDRREVLRLLPWHAWVRAEPELFAPLVALVALENELTELVPVLRGALEQRPHGALIRALGRFRDAESVPRLLRYLREGAPLVRVHAMEALGHIGGDEARRVLRAALRDGDRDVRRVALKALSRCATPAEAELFREAAGESDWFLRLTAAEGLRGLGEAESGEALRLLAADPHPLVARAAGGGPA